MYDRQTKTKQQTLLQKFIRIFTSIKYDRNNGDLKIRILFIRFKIHLYIAKLQKRIDDFEAQQIQNSGLFDYAWYNRTYNHNFIKPDAISYWMNTGYLNGEAPSPHIDMEKVAEFCRVTGKNPITAFLTTNMYLSNHNIFANTKRDNKTIKNYLEQKKKNTSVIYTCITNNYDDINEIRAYTYTNPNYDYVCFTDNQNWIQMGHIGIWEIRPLQYTKLDAGRNNRWHKLHPHELFPEYSESIYLDANINILDNYLFTKIKEIDENIALPEHFQNTSIFQEFETVQSLKFDTDSAIDKTYAIIKDMPPHYGFTENNVIYRRHNNPEIIKIMDEWWDMVEHCSKRDQLSFTYILWKHNIKVEDITFANTRLAKQHFFVFDHKKDRSGNINKFN